MVDLIVFSVAENKYAMNIENVQRIIESISLTSIPNAHTYIDGMMSYEKKVIKVLSFRKLIQMKNYKSELDTLFDGLKKGHAAWVEALRASVETGAAFSKTLDPHACGLGKWIDSFTAYDDHVIEILNELIEYHKQLHVTGGYVLKMYKSDKKEALRMFNVDITSIYEHTMGALDTFIKELDLVADSLQKLIIYDNEGSCFAIKVDTIEDIAHVQESDINNNISENDMSEFLELDGVLDIDGVLINIIKTVKLPK
ncbi:chemotaxis protein CheW [Sulfurimonas sp. SAG-AH-194-C20]|nr:chemotaxis protein CheW [Sulfurimonas sp. SAG-AH-194-C20]MDF1879171.1 chemotaxis protein CheW [Sulfurimonas sp. SAG-AH-194-C20]